jgi:hypothetical protein
MTNIFYLVVADFCGIKETKYKGQSMKKAWRAYDLTKGNVTLFRRYTWGEWKPLGERK